MRTLLYLLFLACLVLLLFFASLLRGTQSLVLIRKAWALLSGTATRLIIQQRPSEQS